MKIIKSGLIVFLSIVILSACTATPEKQANNLKSLGNTAFKQKEFNQAIVHYQQALLTDYGSLNVDELTDNDINQVRAVFYKIAIAYQKLGDYQNAILYHMKTIHISPVRLNRRQAYDRVYTLAIESGNKNLAAEIKRLKDVTERISSQETERFLKIKEKKNAYWQEKAKISWWAMNESASERHPWMAQYYRKEVIANARLAGWDPLTSRELLVEQLAADSEALYNLAINQQDDTNQQHQPVSNKELQLEFLDDWHTVDSAKGRAKICTRNYECDDGDTIALSVNGVIYEEKLTKQSSCRELILSQGYNSISVFAINGNNNTGQCPNQNLNTGKISITSYKYDGGNIIPDKSQTQTWKIKEKAISKSNIYINIK